MNPGPKPEGLVGKWETFEADFLSADIDVPYQMVLTNSTGGQATAWFDDIRIDEIK